ncbi:MAG TPA: hypothetical protein VGQ99_14600 [Tepidisphaeraceae bacterium]|jgi:hypothetical protein|nr:hypothetical protein [Tepidisphaeraceae bacterium]
MDLSKLPKLSETPKPPDNTPPASDPPPPEPTSAGIEAWLSIAVGLFLLLMYPRFLQWLSHRVLGTHFNPFVDANGNVVPYTSIPQFWSDLGPVLFGLVFILEGLVMAFIRRPALIAICLTLTALATLYNLIYLVASYSRFGLAPISFLAVAFGFYICMYQWKYLRLRSPEHSVPMT